MKANQISAGIIGGAGYTGGEAIRLLLRHPDVELRFVQSSSNAGRALWEVHGDLFGDTSMRFSDEVDASVDVLFLCMGHGDSRQFLSSTKLPKELRIIDLSQDFRLGGAEGFVYGLPELNRERIRTATRIANPGCFATAIQLGLLPLAAQGLLKGEVHVSAITGSTGAGQKPTATTHFSWRFGNVSTYKTFEHQHLAEIGESLHGLQPGWSDALNFIPYRGDFTRGIIASTYTAFSGTLDEARGLYEEFYRDAAFTFVSPRAVDLKMVANTNKCLIALEKHGDKLLITSVIDNLLKGASGQAVQNMNLMFGLDERAGLNLKASAF